MRRSLRIAWFSLCAAASAVAQPTAHIALVPASPPVGSYPPGTTSNANEIFLPPFGTETEYTVYFDLIVSNWGGSGAFARPTAGSPLAGGTFSGSCCHVPGGGDVNQPVCDYTTDVVCAGLLGNFCLDVPCERRDCESQSCPLAIRSVLASVQVLRDAPGSICGDPGPDTPSITSLVSGACGGSGGPSLSNIGPGDCGGVKCNCESSATAGAEGPKFDSGSPACFGTYAVKIPKPLVLPPLDDLRFRFELVLPFGLVGTVVLEDQNGQPIEILSASPGFVTIAANGSGTIPAASEWGLLALALGLMVAAKVYFGIRTRSLASRA